MSGLRLVDLINQCPNITDVNLGSVLIEDAMIDPSINIFYNILNDAIYCTRGNFPSMYNILHSSRHTIDVSINYFEKTTANSAKYS